VASHVSAEQICQRIGFVADFFGESARLPATANHLDFYPLLGRQVVHRNVCGVICHKPMRARYRAPCKSFLFAKFMVSFSRATKRPLARKRIENMRSPL